VITICDTRLVVAYLNRNDPHHRWAVTVMKQTSPPMLTGKAVLTKAVYFLREDGADLDPLFQQLERDVLRLAFDLSSHWPRIRSLMGRYGRMDLADAAIAVMSESHPRCQVLTVDRRDPIPFVAPPSR